MIPHGSVHPAFCAVVSIYSRDRKLTVDLSFILALNLITSLKVTLITLIKWHFPKQVESILVSKINSAQMNKNGTETTPDKSLIVEQSQSAFFP